MVNISFILGYFVNHVFMYIILTFLFDIFIDSFMQQLLWVSVMCQATTNFKKTSSK